MLMNFVFADDISGDYEYVFFKRAEYPHAYFHIFGNAYTSDDVFFEVPMLFDISHLKLPKIYPLPIKKASYLGQPIAIVTSHDRYSASDKVEQVDVQYEVVNEPIYDSIPDNILTMEKRGEFSPPYRDQFRFTFNRSSPYPLESRVVAVRHYGDELHITATTQAPTVLSYLISRMLEIPLSKVQVRSFRLGGGFGGKQEVSYEELSVIALSYAKNRNFKWVETKQETLLTMQARGQRHHIYVDYENTGKITAIYDEIEYDLGALPLPWIAYSPLHVTEANLKGPYLYDVSYSAKVILTNRPPLGAFRGFGRPEAVFVIERTVDEIARRLKIDPFEIRKLNLNKELRAGNVQEILKRAEGKYSELKRGNKTVGLSFYIHSSGENSKTLIEGDKVDVGGYECVSVNLERDGWITVRTSITDHGQFNIDNIKKVVSTTLSYNKVRVISGDQSVTGFGTWASRSAITAGNAAYLAAKDFTEIARSILDSEKIDWEKLIDIYRNSPWLLNGKYLHSYRCYEADEEARAFSIQMAVAKIDEEIPEIKYVYLISDVGNVIDEDVVKGQLIGGIVQGLSGLLLEDVEQGPEYSILTASDAPEVEIELIHTPADNPLGVKGVGENSITGIYASAGNALSSIYNADNVPLIPWKNSKM
ncbi:quinoline 2-oxidoreductase [Sulfolobales archaeon HS-7]|nr:quinoline 2-oxidoreductase [Sulfolobales archaeon HS-7]